MVHRGVIAVATPRRGGRELYDLGVFANYEPQHRAIKADLEPYKPIDPSRMGYLFGTSFMSHFFQDAYSGRYDFATCTNVATGEVWSWDPTIP